MPYAGQRRDARASRRRTFARRRGEIGTAIPTRPRSRQAIAAPCNERPAKTRSTRPTGASRPLAIVQPQKTKRSPALKRCRRCSRLCRRPRRIARKSSTTTMVNRWLASRSVVKMRSGCQKLTVRLPLTIRASNRSTSCRCGRGRFAACACTCSSCGRGGRKAEPRLRAIEGNVIDAHRAALAEYDAASWRTRLWRSRKRRRAIERHRSRAVTPRG